MGKTGATFLLMKINPILDEQVEAQIENELANESPQLEKINDWLDVVFRDPALKFGLKFFQNSERAKLKMREREGKIEIYCLSRSKWLRAKPEEVVRQLFLVYVRDSMFYPMERVGVEWPMQMGEDAEK